MDSIQGNKFLNSHEIIISKQKIVIQNFRTSAGC